MHAPVYVIDNEGQRKINVSPCVHVFPLYAEMHMWLIVCEGESACVCLWLCECPSARAAYVYLRAHRLHVYACARARGPDSVCMCVHC